MSPAMTTRTLQFVDEAAFAATLPADTQWLGEALYPLPASMAAVSVVGGEPFVVVFKGVPPPAWAAFEIYPQQAVRNFGAEPAGPSLADRKRDKNAQINAARMAANRENFAHAGKVFACDALSRGDIDGINGFISLMGVLPPGWPGAWKAVDNSYHPLPDLLSWKLFYTAMIQAGNANFARSQALKAALAAATTPDQVAAITWEPAA